ncbi:protein ULTRAPETALA 1 isoform X2 [Carex littledalei]|uniref:Protein ULTRAPETALA 1 isoform X2 n=1 Tax=Carex littledalei TaxID=544730 RepID=A0A833VJM1_9POAL|nr:protein ULTRAPETALA 1 isoform X2 [Carex littledalei]
MQETIDSNSVKIEDCANMFQDFEVKDMYGFNNGENFIDVICGCTSYRYGDTVGTLRVYASGVLEIRCECNPTCHEVLKPTEFEKHALKESPGRWRNNIWVTIGSEKVPLSRTVLLRYSNVNLKAHPSKRKVHRDEFVKCNKCSKRRRFVVGTEKQYREYHDAEIDGNWECSRYLNGIITCAEKEERGSKRRARGCHQDSSCSGCTKCVCFGCKMCRFSDCNCQTCIDFLTNADI